MTLPHTNMTGVAAAIAAALIAFAPPASAAPLPPFDDAAAGLRHDIGVATEALNTLRDRQAAERTALSGQHAEVVARVDTLRGQVEQAQRQQRQTQSEYEALQQALQRERADAELMRAVLIELRRSLDSRTVPPEMAAASNALDTAEAGLRDPSPAALPPTANSLLDVACETLLNAIQGRRFDSVCIDAAGWERRGQFAVVGPLLYFSSPEAAGLVATDPTRTRMTLHPGHRGDSDAIRDLLAGRPAHPPVDISGGKALTASLEKPSFMTTLYRGGFTMIPLLGVGALALGLTLLKTWELARLRLQAPAQVEAIALALRTGNTADAARLCDALGHPLGPILAAGVQYCGATRENMEEIMHERMLALMPALERHLGFIAVLGGVAPLLGLLGTVTGMMHTFQLVRFFGAGHPRLLSGGISEALITTVAGLIIAIPTLLVHAYLSRRVRTIAGRIEQAIVTFINRLTLSADDHA